MTTDDSAETTWVGSMPEIYDRCLGPAIFAPYAGDVALRAMRLAPQRVLEIAAGTGIVTAGLVEALPGAEITATDLNGAMVQYAGQRVPGPTWQVADATDLALPDDAFDLVVCQFGVMFFPDRIGAHREVRRVLEPDGHYLFSAWDVVDGSDITAVLVEALAEVFPDDPPDFVVRVPHGYHDPDRIRADAQAGGLVVEDIERVVLRGTTPSAATAAEGFCLGTPLRFELQQRGDLGDIVPRVAAAMTERLGEGPLDGGLSAYVVTARSPL